MRESVEEEDGKIIKAGSTLCFEGCSKVESEWGDIHFRGTVRPEDISSSSSKASRRHPLFANWRIFASRFL